jgi:carbamoyl-phosphate synthase large subunit
MPKRTDLQKILIIGAGPIVIGQGCEFDYAGTQACKALREEGYQVVLVNSNPATIMTDRDLADRTYIEPITPEILTKIIDRERPCAILPTMGGQTALNMAVTLSESGVLSKYGVELIGASYASIQRAEHRETFKQVVREAGLLCPESASARSREEALGVIDGIGFPAIIRSSFTLGGAGGSIVYNREEFEQCVENGLAASPIHEILIEASVLGWKEFELEVMRDRRDNVVIVCSIENVDPMGIHTGDSVTVAPAQTLSDREYQAMRDAAIRIMRGVGVDTGGSNIQFALNPQNGDLRVIEMNPRVSRSSALASKATGFPIAKIAAKLAVGFTLDEIPNDITRVTPASFEPTLDYVVVKIPRFAFEKFPDADPTLTLQMKSVGEVMALGRNFKEALMKALRSLEATHDYFHPRDPRPEREDLLAALAHPTMRRLWQIADALRLGVSVPEIHRVTQVDPWFIQQVLEILQLEPTLTAPLSEAAVRKAKSSGYSDHAIGRISGLGETKVAAFRAAHQIVPVYKRVDTCGAEFEADTPYFYSTYETVCEAAPTSRKKVVILGSGPNRIGQGIEFDYCCVHAAMAVRESGYESVMVNCNPETVSTDYDTSDRLYFEPLTFEDVLHIVRRENPIGVVVQFGGQTPLKLALPLSQAGVPILGTPPDAIDQAEDRERFQALLSQLGFKQPASGLARTAQEAAAVAETIGYPVMVRPSYVLGGRAMQIIYDAQTLLAYVASALNVSPAHPVLVDKYLEDAVEIDVDAVSDGQETFIGGIMEHIEEAGIHSGDSACSLPPFSLDAGVLEVIRQQTTELARALSVIGLMNIQFAVKGGEVYILEVNPRASRTIPFVGKALGVPLAQVAMRAMLGIPLRAQNIQKKPLSHIAVKEAVLPFRRLRVDPLLGPEMKSTGEVMGMDHDFGMAFAKAQAGAGNDLPRSGQIFVSIKDRDKPAMLPVAAQLLELGFDLVATRGTAAYLNGPLGGGVKTVNKVAEGRPHILDLLKNGEIALVLNTAGDKRSEADSYSIRQTVLTCGIPYFTTVAGARAAATALSALIKNKMEVKALQDYT